MSYGLEQSSRQSSGRDFHQCRGSYGRGQTCLSCRQVFRRRRPHLGAVLSRCDRRCRVRQIGVAGAAARLAWLAGSARRVASATRNAAGDLCCQWVSVVFRRVVVVFVMSVPSMNAASVLCCRWVSVVLISRGLGVLVMSVPSTPGSDSSVLGIWPSPGSFWPSGESPQTEWRVTHVCVVLCGGGGVLVTRRCQRNVICSGHVMSWSIWCSVVFLCRGVLSHDYNDVRRIALSYH